MLEPTLVSVQKDIVLKIRGLSENIHITSGKPIVIGRFTKDNQLQIDVDLAPYGATKHGVSRLHARLELDDKRRLYVTDLGSTNGTILAGRRLKPHVRALVLHGHKIAFGTLVAKISFMQSNPILPLEQ